MSGFTIVDEGEGLYNDQSTVFQEDIDILVDGMAGSALVLSGGVITGGGSMTPAVAKAAVMSGGLLLPVTAGTVTIGTAHASLPRIDLIVADASGVKQVRAGTAATNPKPPVRTAGDVALGRVDVGPGVTTIPTTAITDKRILRTSDIVIKKTTTPVVVNTSAAAGTFFTTTLPSGLFLAGRQLHVVCGGDYLINSGTPTITLAIDYGGTTMFADATAAFTADSDRGTWMVDFILNASANAVQQLIGRAIVQTPGAKAAATTGQGDLAVVTSVLGPFYGTAAVDSDAADRTLNVKWTMSVSNVANEITGVGFARLL